MFRFAIKKAFFDTWDQLFFTLAVNLVYTLTVLGLASLSVLLPSTGTLGYLFLYAPVPFLAAALLGGVATYWARDISLHGAGKLADIGSHLAASWKPSVVFGLVWLLLLAGWTFGVPFYGAWNSIAGFGFGLVIAWLFFFAAGMGLYYPGLNAQVEPNLRKLVRKSFLLFVANPWASFGTLLGLVVCLLLSTFTLGFFPGIIGTSIWLQVCFKFVLAKYEWLEANPEADKKKIPWGVVLAEDMEKVGPRTLKSLIFPWRD